MQSTKAAFDAKRAASGGWIIPPARGRHLPWWPHRMADADGGRVTVGAGAFRVGVHANPTHFSMYGWHDAPGLPAAVELSFDDLPRDRNSGRTAISWRDDGFALRGEWVDGEVDWLGQTGHFQLRLEATREVAAARLGVLEASIATLMGLVLRAGGLLLHAASLAIDGGGVVIVGESGRGKTTLCQRFPDSFLNEEFAFLAPTGQRGGWQLHWYAQERGPASERPAVLPVHRLCLLSARRDALALRPATAAEALAVLHAASLWVPGIPPALQLAAMDGLLKNHSPTWLAHDLQSPLSDLVAALRSPA